ncbi:MAG: nitrogenase component 1, partial [Elusimicrobiota bacterium]
LRTIAAALGREERAEAFLVVELRRLAPVLEWVIPRVFLNRAFVFAGDPYLYAGWKSLESEVGLRLTGAFFNAGPQHDDGAERGDIVTAFEPSVEALRRSWHTLRDEGAELLVASSDVLAHLSPDGARLEFGFPSVDWHCLRDTPYLGLRGCAHLLERLASVLTRRDAEAA